MELEFFVSKEAIPTKEHFLLENTTARASLDSRTLINMKETLLMAHMTDKGDSYGQTELPLLAIFRKANESKGNSSTITEKSL